MDFKRHDIVWTPANVSRFWGYINSNTSLNDIYFAKMVGRSVVSHLNKHVSVEGKSILDFGCGPGYLFKYLNESYNNFSYYGLDFSEDSVKRLKDTQKENKNFKDAYFVSGYPTNIQEKFDVIVCCEVLEHLDDQTLAMITAEFKRLLKPKGQLYITVPNNEDLDLSKVMCPDCGGTFHKWQHQRSWNKKTITNHFEGNGFNTSGIFEKHFASNPRKTLAFELATTVLQRKRNNLVWIGTLN